MIPFEISVQGLNINSNVTRKIKKSSVHYCFLVVVF